ncbi:hypothetical protein EDD29_3602 [Actinocorallia herbida]|uniref:Uncharacterized protein n=1 Tax=Actinocorallia herbida TaxID=58109 RepID=A0A3N1CXP2_9ACTN|nr:hypothetical protein [Actinocorallia herbida]ROO86041.1 hypothetical protein EDD29_3602 [Actinocorallia herbida]
MKTIAILAGCLVLVLLSSAAFDGLPDPVEAVVFCALALIFILWLLHGLRRALMRTLDARFAILSAASLLVTAAIVTVADQGVLLDLRFFLSRGALERVAEESVVVPGCESVDLEKAPVTRAGLFEIRCAEHADGVTDLYLLSADGANIWLLTRTDPGSGRRDDRFGINARYSLTDRWTIGAIGSVVGPFILPSALS